MLNIRNLPVVCDIVYPKSTNKGSMVEKVKKRHDMLPHTEEKAYQQLHGVQQVRIALLKWLFRAMKEKNLVLISQM